MATAIIYRSYAKINLYLDVLKRRRDGYHDIETIFQTVALSDELIFREDPVHVSLSCSAPELDSAESNLVYRATMLLKERTGCSLGARIRLEKRIPIAAGLAGGSGNAAATLVALNSLWDLRLTARQIHEFALELGSDVPYCVIGGTLAATRRGEVMTPLSPAPATWLLLVHPPMPVSASRVYNSSKLAFSNERPFAGKTARFRAAIRHVERGDWDKAVFNRMEDPVFASHPQLADAKQRLIEGGCVAAAMSGSGPTLFGICRTRNAASRLAERFSDYTTSVVSTIGLALERIH